jgi:hypothetical protein
MCKQGLHASIKALDALQYAPGAIVCRVEMSGNIIYDTDKCVASERTVLWYADATKALHTFACDEAERALSAMADPDPRSIAAIAVKRRWIDGKATDAELAAARDAAWAAAMDAMNAAWAVAMDAMNAAWAVAMDAAWAVARDAAGDAAWAAAGDEAWAAVRDARDAARAAARAAALAARAAARDAAEDAWNAARAEALAAAEDAALAAAWAEALAAARDAALAAANQRLEATLVQLAPKSWEKPYA